MTTNLRNVSEKTTRQDVCNKDHENLDYCISYEYVSSGIIPRQRKTKNNVDNLASNNKE